MGICLGRRAIHQASTPSFDVRIDTSNPNSSAASNGGDSIGFTCDSGMLLKIKESLINGIEENGNENSLRFQKYLG